MVHVFSWSFSPKFQQDLENARCLWRRIANSILNLEAFVTKHPDSIARTLLTDISTHVWQITREFLVVGRASDWSLKDEHLNEFVRTCFAAPASTKASLESAFNALIDKGRHAKSNKMSPYTRWSYLSLNSFAETGGINTLKLRPDDFQGGAQGTYDYQYAKELPHFAGVRSAELPAECPSRKDLKENRRFLSFFLWLEVF